VLAVYYPDARAVVERYGDALSGKVVVDITNPVNETFDGLVTPPDGSAARELAAPTTRSTCSWRATTRTPRAPSPGWPKTAACVPSTSRRSSGPASSRASGSLHMGVQSALGTNFASALKVLP
jgi:hypothetical protein